MIIGIGIDSVEVARFASWTKLPQKQLLRVYSIDELTYALSNTLKSAERLAVRFAAREALFKALSNVLYIPIPFLTLCACCHVKSSGTPSLYIDFDQLQPFISVKAPFKTHLSLSHTQTNALACVILER